MASVKTKIDVLRGEQIIMLFMLMYQYSKFKCTLAMLKNQQKMYLWKQQKLFVFSLNYIRKWQCIRSNMMNTLQLFAFFFISYQMTSKTDFCGYWEDNSRPESHKPVIVPSAKMQN